MSEKALPQAPALNPQTEDPFGFGTVPADSSILTDMTAKATEASSIPVEAKNDLFDFGADPVPPVGQSF